MAFLGKMIISYNTCSCHTVKMLNCLIKLLIVVNTRTYYILLAIKFKKKSHPHKTGILPLLKLPGIKLYKEQCL